MFSKGLKESDSRFPTLVRKDFFGIGTFEWLWVKKWECDWAGGSVSFTPRDIEMKFHRFDVT